MKTFTTTRCDELTQLCENVRDLVSHRNFEHCTELLCKAMADYPSAPQPHNLLGIVLEKTGSHPAAMKHFRAAWALDPTYMPANRNLERYGTFHSGIKEAYDECDCAVQDRRSNTGKEIVR